MSDKHKKTAIKVVLSGAPSSGKSSVISTLSSLGEGIIAIPETAAVLLGGGYPSPRVDDLDEQRLFQGIILSLQKNMEAMFEAKYPDAKMFILDRGTLDGVAYWPMGPEAYLEEFNIDTQAELARYDRILFFETPEERFFGGMGRKRFHNYEQSREIGCKQRVIWSQHPGFVLIPNADDFRGKVDCALQALSRMLEE